MAPLLPSSASPQAVPPEVAICDVQKAPETFDGRAIRLRGFVNLEFEDFSLHSEQCDTWPQIWLMFGGDVPTPTMSTAGDTTRTEGKDLTISGISYPLVRDENFRKFISLITSRSSEQRIYPSPGYKTTATLTGTFFAGHSMKNAAGKVFGAGYGHLGCCYLFVIKQISDVDSVPATASELLGTVVSTSGKPIGGVAAVSETPSSILRQRQETKSDDSGHFRFLYSGQMIWFRHTSFRPADMMLKPGQSDVHVVLEDSRKSDWLVPTCVPIGARHTQIGRDIKIRLPGNAAVSGKRDRDSLAQTITFQNESARDKQLSRLFPIVDSMQIKSGKKGEQIEDAEQILDPYHYWEPGKERWLKDSRGTAIGVDARGESTLASPQELSRIAQMTGLRGLVRWRTTIVFGQGVASYISRPELAPLFDQIIDSACIEASAPE